jgi:hypothetical protein
LTEGFDTATPMGRGVLALLAAVAEDERETPVKYSIVMGHKKIFYVLVVRL